MFPRRAGVVCIGVVALTACGSRTALDALAPTDAGVSSDTAAVVDAPRPLAPRCIAGEPPRVIVEVGCARRSGSCVGWLASDVEAVYFLNASPSQYGIYRVPMSGGATSRVVADGDAPFAIDGAAIFWETRGAGAILRAPTAGGPSQALVAAMPSGRRSFDVSNDALYFTDGTSLMRVPKTGGALALVATTRGDALSIHGSDATNVYASLDSAYTPALHAFPKDGGQQSVVPGIAGAVRVVVRDNTLYATTTDVRVRAVDLDGANARVLATAQSNLGYLAVDETSVYWSAADGFGSSGHVLKVPRGGGARVEVAKLDDAGTFAVDESCLYFVKDGAVRRVAK